MPMQNVVDPLFDRIYTGFQALSPTPVAEAELTPYSKRLALAIRHVALSEAYPKEYEYLRLSFEAMGVVEKLNAMVPKGTPTPEREFPGLKEGWILRSMGSATKDLLSMLNVPMTPLMKHHLQHSLSEPMNASDVKVLLSLLPMENFEDLKALSLEGVLNPVVSHTVSPSKHRL